MWKKASPSLTITLPSPCGEDWQSMSPVDQGRHCKACDKVVIDFTRMSDEEIIDFFQASPNTCGRFKESSLNRNLIKTPAAQRFLHLPRLVWGIMLGMALSMRQELKAQNLASLMQSEQIQTDEKLPIHGGNIQIRGVVRDSISGNPISGANIYFSANGNGSISDYDGIFYMYISKASFEQNQRIQISYLGYETKDLELSIADSSIELEVRLVQSNMILHEVNIVAREEPSNFRTFGGAPLIHREDGKTEFRHRLWWRILHPFHRCGNGE